MSNSTRYDEPKEGDRVRLVRMQDPGGLRPGAEGTVVYIGEVTASEVAGDPSMSHLAGRKKFWVKWDGGEAMALIESVDRFEVL